MPWRQYTDPYPIWVSEVMLQQTTVATVKPYFEKFMQKWPNIHQLAEATQNDVYLCWQGLGYYRRAEYLHKAAQIISKEGWPKTALGLSKLPGFGPYTSRAVAAIAFGESTLPIDGNIARVMARVLGLKGTKANIIKQLNSYDWGHIPEPSCVTQGLMDLAQSLCKVKDTLCFKCPLQSQCLNQGIYPFEKELVRKRKMYAQAFCFAEGGVMACELSSQFTPSPSLLKSLFGPPMSVWADEPLHLKSLEDNKTWLPCGKVRHIFSHIDLEVDVYMNHTFHSSKLPENKPLSRLAEKIIQTAHKKSLSNLVA